MKTLKDYNLSNYKLSFAVVTKDNVVLQAGFRTKEVAEDFKNNAYFGYYKECIIKMVKTH